MAIRIDVKRTYFYSELSEKERNEYFNLKRDKFLPCIDNIYYTVMLADDYNGNQKLKQFLINLEMLKVSAISNREPQAYGDYDLYIDTKSYDIYTYCLTKPDLYDIFISKYLPNESTPRIAVQIRAFGLWTRGEEELLAESYADVLSIFELEHDVKILKCRENRIDYCYHTNAIQSLSKITTDAYLSKHMKTTMERMYEISSLDTAKNGTIRNKEYISLGTLKSNNVTAKIYNKGKEVIDKGYKGFFFDIWYDNGLISYYDKFCFETAYSEKNRLVIHKARLEFYLTHGTNETIKTLFKETLNDVRSTYTDIKALADKYMPNTTTIVNIEFTTKRKFYYYSDNWIDDYLKTDTAARSSVPAPLERIYKIIDNKSVFLKYLTSTTLSFRKNGEEYLSWWDRLRNTKLKGLNLDLKLVREYAHELDGQQSKKRLINALGIVALYNDKVLTGFEEDASDVISIINDNDKHLVEGYIYKKLKKEERIKNRKKRPLE